MEGLKMSAIQRLVINVEIATSVHSKLGASELTLDMGCVRLWLLHVWEHTPACCRYILDYERQSEN